MPLDYYDTTNVITTSQPIELDPESNLYQSEDVWKKYKRLSRKITVLNVGPGILYARASHDGTYFSEEAVIYEGNSKDYDEIYCIKLRSPSANLRYRTTEYTVSTVSGQQFSGSRFKDRRDRDGVIVYQDDYESSTLKFDALYYDSITNTIENIALAPPPTSIVRSTDTSFAGDFSIKTIGGPNIGDGISIVYLHPDFHVGKIANQIHFATGELAFSVNLELDYYDDVKLHQAFVSFAAEIDSSFKLLPVKLFVATQLRNPLPPHNLGPLVLIEVPTEITLHRSIFAWNVLKLTVDISTFKYVAVFVNGERIDLSGFDMLIYSSNTSRHINSFVEGITAPINGLPFPVPDPIIYFDNYLFTEDETFT